MFRTTLDNGAKRPTMKTDKLGTPLPQEVSFQWGEEPALVLSVHLSPHPQADAQAEGNVKVARAAASLESRAEAARPRPPGPFNLFS